MTPHKFGSGRKPKPAADKYDNFPVRVTFKCNDDQAQWLVDTAQERDCSVSALIREWIDSQA